MNEKLWPFKFLERFRCSISSVSIYYVPETDIWVKSCDHLNFSRGSVVQFRVSRYIMRLNQTSVWKDHLNFTRAFVDLFRASWYITLWIGHPCEKLWPFKFPESFRWSITSVLLYYALESDTRVKSYDHLNFLRASVVQFRASQYIMSPNQTSKWKVMIIWISREAPFFNFDRLDILCARIGHPCEKLWPFKFLEGFRCSIPSVSIYYVPESDIRVKSYDHLNFSRAFVFKFWASRYITI